MIIGVSGKARSGKGEFAKVAKEEFGATIVSFAAGVKEEVAEWLTDSEVCWSHRNLYGENEDKEALLRAHHSFIEGTHMTDFVVKFGDYQLGYWYFTPRALMQWWGTDYRRAQDKDYWVKKGLAKCVDRHVLYIIDDVRFPNEAEAVQSYWGSALVRVDRNDRPSVSNEGHLSEVALDDYDGWDFKIKNNTTLENYHSMVRMMLKQVTAIRVSIDKVLEVTGVNECSDRI